MSRTSIYQQFCPLALATEVLCQRWTILILRELYLGSSSFNDISRGVSRMSRTLLSSRLKTLCEYGIIDKRVKSSNQQTRYSLTPAGEGLRSVVFAMADWSQEWLHIEPSLEHIEADHLMWCIRRSAKHHVSLPSPFIAHFILIDQQDSYRNSWLIFENNDVDLCIIDHDFDVNVEIETTALNMIKVWMGWRDFKQAVKAKEIVLRGLKKYTDTAPLWIGNSRLASIKKQPKQRLIPPQ